MKISVFGLGYVGCVSLACLADLDHNLIGCDIVESKVNLINEGKATIVEKDVDELIGKGVLKGNIKATVSVSEAVKQSEVAIICVGTPNDENGNLDLSHIYHVIEQIAEELRNKNSFYSIAIRSTVPIGTNERCSAIVEKKSGKINQKDFGIVSNPEFLREGSAVQDFLNPPYTVLASKSELAIEKMRNVYLKIKSEIFQVDIPTAELIKFVNNSWHALKVAFGNEIGRICKKIDTDSLKLMELFSKDTQLNISKIYLRPGFAYGGSCLPKDLKALNTLAHDNYIKTPLLNAVHQSNEDHLNYAYNLLISLNNRKIGFYGLSFKEGTDDLRYSPALELVERLLGKGYEITVYDNNINISRLTGKNKEFLISRLPHIANILVNDFSELKKRSDVLVFVHPDDTADIDFDDKIIVDYSGKLKDRNLNNYVGIAW